MSGGVDGGADVGLVLVLKVIVDVVDTDGSSVTDSEDGRLPSRPDPPPLQADQSNGPGTRASDATTAFHDLV